jgi:hypothetical protein
MTDKTVGQQVTELRDYLDARRVDWEELKGMAARKHSRLKNSTASIWERVDGKGYVVDDIGWYLAGTLEEAREIVEKNLRLANLMHAIAWAEINASGDSMGPLDQYR